VESIFLPLSTFSSRRLSDWSELLVCSRRNSSKKGPAVQAIVLVPSKRPPHLFRGKRGLGTADSRLAIATATHSMNDWLVTELTTY